MAKQGLMAKSPDSKSMGFSQHHIAFSLLFWDQKRMVKDLGCLWSLRKPGMCPQWSPSIPSVAMARVMQGVVKTGQLVLVPPHPPGRQGEEAQILKEKQG